MKDRLVILATIFILLTSCTNLPEQDEHLVLTSLSPIFQLTKALTEDTNIDVKNIPERPRNMASQPAFFARQGENFSELFYQADAVITVGKVWQEDPLFTSARLFNIRIINIDASQPWSYERSGVALARSPVSNEISPYFWTSPGNLIRMMETIAWDLQKLYPDQTAILISNLDTLKHEIFTLNSYAENSLLSTAEDPVIYALTDNFISLTNELGLYIDGYKIKQDIDWTDEDLSQLTSHLIKNNINIVIHKWTPSLEIQTAIQEAGAQLVILDNLELSIETLNNGLSKNLNALLSGLNH